MIADRWRSQGPTPQVEAFSLVFRYGEPSYI
jgi:hypothetical protein